LCTGSGGCEFTQAGQRASGEGAKEAREATKGSLKKREKIVWQGDRRVQSSQKWWRNRKNEEKNLVFVKSLAEYFKKRFP